MVDPLHITYFLLPCYFVTGHRSPPPEMISGMQRAPTAPAPAPVKSQPPPLEMGQEQHHCRPPATPSSPPPSQSRLRPRFPPSFPLKPPLLHEAKHDDTA
ncbi:hypothetical protein HKD37_10G029042 [Glycine soja]|nr:hypothetical protein GmHk_10G029547 [Glycine max]